MDFSSALIELKENNKKVHRSGWNGKNMYIELYIPALGSALTHSFICMKTANDKYIPWLASQEDILSNDWEIRED